MNFILRKDKITFWKSYWEESYPANICLFQVNNRNTRKRCEICSKLTIKTLERRHLNFFVVFIVNFENISHHFFVFLLFTLSKKILAG